MKAIANDVPIPTPAPSAGLPASSEDGWFRTLSSKADCALTPRVSSVTPSATHFLVVFDADMPGVIERIEEAGTISHKRVVLPVLELETDSQRAAALMQAPGIMAVLTALGGLPSSRTLAHGFDLLCGISRMQHEQVSELRYGGRSKGEAAGYPSVVHTDSGMVFNDDGDDWPAPPALVPVINFSVGPVSVKHPYLANDLVNIATMLSAHHVLVVLAAGNCGELGESTMSAWARAPWVLAVGATSDEEGTILAPYSSRGTADDPDSGPDVVAYGGSFLPPFPQGTSFAAPRVSHLARLVTAAMAQLGREVRMADSAEPHGVPLVGMGLIDDWREDFGSFPTELIPLPALPIIGVEVESVKAAVAVAREAGIHVDVLVNPSLLRTFLMNCATEIPGYRPHEVGRGFIDVDRVLDGLASLTFRDIITMFATKHGEDLAPEHFAAYRVFVRDELVTLDRVLRITGPHVQYDFKSQQLDWLPNSGT